MDIDVELKEDGDVFVTENQTYTFESEFNGITRVLIPKEGTDIVNVEARENNEDLKIEQDDTEYKIHRKGENEIGRASCRERVNNKRRKEAIEKKEVT